MDPLNMVLKEVSSTKELIQDVKKLLSTFIEEYRAGCHPVPLTARERKILSALGDRELKGSAIARRAKLTDNSHLRTKLAELVKRGILDKGSKGYFVPKRS